MNVVYIKNCLDCIFIHINNANNCFIFLHIDSSIRMINII